MKLRQLVYVREVAQRGLNVTAAAEALYTSQPGVSKQIRMLEDELGVDIFERNGKHLASITPAGKRILDYTERLLQNVRNIETVASEYREVDNGELSLATTHTQARYALPPTIKTFRSKYPKVRLQIRQGSPPQIAGMAADGDADFAIATEALEHFQQLVMLPCYRWNRCVLVKPDHPLAKVQRLELRDVAAWPIVTYTFGFTGRSKLDKAFGAQQLKPEVVLTAVDADVIKTYVRLGLGIGIVADMAWDPKEDADLVRLSADHLFEPSTTHIGFRYGSFLRGYMYDFIGWFAPHLTRKVIDEIGAIADPAERQARTARLNAELEPV
ncbi:MAG TPA: HTH-type transcriptional regulator CysB [Nevskiaceae bacterium]